MAVNRLESFESISEASCKTGIGTSSISNNLNNKSKHAGGFIWKDEEETICQ